MHIVKVLMYIAVYYFHCTTEVIEMITIILERN